MRNKKLHFFEWSFPYMKYERIFATELVLDMDNSFTDVKLYIQ